MKKLRLGMQVFSVTRREVGGEVRFFLVGTCGCGCAGAGAGRARAGGRVVDKERRVIGRKRRY